jgi:hypothetical protein
MHAERTPNPNSIKWVLDRPIVEPGVSAHFDVRPSEEVSPLAARLLGIEGVGVVELYLQGACSGCPGAAATLKHGIETRLREAVPEVQAVVAL